MENREAPAREEGHPGPRDMDKTCSLEKWDSMEKFWIKVDKPSF